MCGSTDPSRHEGFDEVREGRYVRVVRRPKWTRSSYVRTVCVWRGEPFVVLGRARGVVAGGVHRRPAPVARKLGLEEFDFGVYQGWAPRRR